MLFLHSDFMITVGANHLLYHSPDDLSLIFLLINSLQIKVSINLIHSKPPFRGVRRTHMHTAA